MIQGHAAARYTPCKSGATANLHGAAFFPDPEGAILRYVARKRTNWIAHWRKFKGLNQPQLVERLIEYAERNPDVDVPRTGASLSRIENGEQNFKRNLLYAVAEILSADGDPVTPGDLLSRNPFAGTAQIISMVDRLDDEQRQRAVEVLNAIFGDRKKA